MLEGFNLYQQTPDQPQSGDLLVCSGTQLVIAYVYAFLRGARMFKKQLFREGVCAAMPVARIV